jgi:hypothetical protein
VKGHGWEAEEDEHGAVTVTYDGRLIALMSRETWDRLDKALTGRPHCAWCAPGIDCPRHPSDDEAKR